MHVAQIAAYGQASSKKALLFASLRATLMRAADVKHATSFRGRAGSSSRKCRASSCAIDVMPEADGRVCRVQRIQ